jgi:hypothetical protein
MWFKPKKYNKYNFIDLNQVKPAQDALFSFYQMKQKYFHGRKPPCGAKSIEMLASGRKIF